MKKVIITGPTGPIGHALIEECINNNIEVFAICRPKSPRIKELPNNELLKIIEIDLNNLLEARELLPEKIDVFYHLGWSGTFGDIRNNIYLQNKNVEYTLDAVELAHLCGCNTFIGAGSQAEYGRVEGKITASTSTVPENGYGIAKLCAGIMSRIQAHKYGIRHIWTRILSVYGPYDGANTMVMSTISKLFNGEKPIFTKGEQMWDYLYPKDAGSIMLSLSGERSIDGKIYVLGSGTVRPLREYIEIIRDNIEPSLELGIGELPYSKQQVMYLCADNEDICNGLNYSYKYDFYSGIKETIDWYRTNKR